MNTDGESRFDDDGRTIADMSSVDGFAAAESSSSSRDIREELSGADERRALIFGATWAGLSLGLVYVVIFGLVIAAMLMLWR